MKITIENGQDSHTLDAEVFLFGSTSASLSVDSSVVTLSTDAAGFADFHPVRTINEIHPAADGSFYVSGSECDSWEYLGPATIGLMDLCPACQTCDAVYKMKYELENLKLFINAIKDANLYSKDVVTDRLAMLDAQRMFSGVDTPCISVDSLDQVYPKGLQLLQQYVTLVRMWNYVVSQNNSSTIIDVAPEDTSGFTIQTKRSLPSCGCDSQIMCELRINYFGYIRDPHKETDPEHPDTIIEVGGGTITVASQPPPDAPHGYLRNGISLYTPDPVITGPDEYGNPIPWPTKTAQRSEFKPFATTDFSANPVETFDGIINESTDRMISCTGCTYSTGFMGVQGEVKNAGTYAVYLKVLPFNGVIMYNYDNQPINIRDGVNLTGSTISGSTATEYLFEPKSVVFPCYNDGGVNAKEEDYLNSKCAPSVSVPYKNVWKVEVTWTIKRAGEADQVYSDTYYYTCTGIPLYYGDKVMTNSTLEEFPSESSNA